MKLEEENLKLDSQKIAVLRHGVYDLSQTFERDTSPSISQLLEDRDTLNLIEEFRQLKDQKEVEPETMERYLGTDDWTANKVSMTDPFVMTVNPDGSIQVSRANSEDEDEVKRAVLMSADKQ